MKKELASLDNLSGVDKRKLTTRNIAEELMRIMRNHIGAENDISRAMLFHRIFRKREEDTLQDWLRWEFVKKAMHYLRVKTHCFIGSRRKRTSLGNKWTYFVISTMSDAQYYSEILQNNINRMRRMQERAIKSVEQSWHKEAWELPKHTRHPLLED